MASFASKRMRASVFLFALLTAGLAAFPAEALARQKSSSPCKVIVLGYVGGLDTPGNPLSGIVRIRNRLRSLNDAGLCVETFSAYTWLDGYHWLTKKLNDARAPGPAAPGGEVPKVIIYGHSLGGWATLAVARRLAARNIPVELTVQIDSVGFTDATVPANVKEAANYYRWAIVPPYGRGKIRAQDGDATRILGNFELKRANHYGIAGAAAISDLIVAKVRALFAAPE
jgi:pimeloyl-ACP methyl ester carboxylesterase